MKRKQLILLGGGVKQGKSAFALARARRLGRRRAFVATAQPSDADMRGRIAMHQRERGTDFETVEAPLNLVFKVEALSGYDVVVVDCLTLWFANMLLQGVPMLGVAGHVDDLREVLAQRRFHTILVTNEVGMGIVPETPLGRSFRDVTGLAHQCLAQEADEVAVAILGVILRLKPAPVGLYEA